MQWLALTLCSSTVGNKTLNIDNRCSSQSIPKNVEPYVMYICTFSTHYLYCIIYNNGNSFLFSISMFFCSLFPTLSLFLCVCCMVQWWIVLQLFMSALKSRGLKYKFFTENVRLYSERCFENCTEGFEIILTTYLWSLWIQSKTMATFHKNELIILILDKLKYQGMLTILQKQHWYHLVGQAV